MNQVKSDTYLTIYQLVQKLVEAHTETKTHLGEAFFDVPKDQVVLQIRTIQVAPGHKIELGLTTAVARPAFEWFAEITIDKRPDGDYKHYLLRNNNEIVEAYGRNVTEIDETEATLIAKELRAVK